MRNVSVRMLALDGVWEASGVDRARGVWPENLELTADEIGSVKASFDLRRSPDAMWPDLAGETPIDIDVDGLHCWSGQIPETPVRDAAGADIINVQAVGKQALLDDDQYERAYVHTKLGDWRDARSWPQTNVLTAYSAGLLVGSDNGAITLGCQKGVVWRGRTAAGVTLDLGQSDAYAKRIIINVKRGEGAPGGVYVYCRNHDVAGGSYGVPAATEDGFAPVSLATIPQSGTTLRGTFATPRRFVTIFLYLDPAADSTPTADWTAVLTGLKVFTDTAYESGDASVLTADDVLLDALLRAPGLTPDLAGIAAGTFSIPDLAYGEARSPREQIAAALAYEDMQLRVGVDGLVSLRARSTAPLFEIGAWSGADMSNTGDSSAEIYNRVTIEGTGPDGERLSVKRSAPAGSTILDRRSRVRRKILPVNAALTQAMAERIGDIWLSSKRTTPMKGEIKLEGDRAVRRVLDGSYVTGPELVLAGGGELLRIGHYIDPDTGGVGRDARMPEITWRHATDETSITLDNSRSNVEALLERLAVVTTAGR